MRGKLLSLLTGVAVVVGLLATPATPAQAASGSDFDAADIMSDSLFYDGSAMTSAQIQSFLDSKIGNCSSSDCINILRTSVSSRAARISDTTGNLVCKAFTGGTNLLVSEIIYRSQVACGISAKVILVTLQKEQGLVTSKNPSDWNLNYAMGQACPDTAPCDPAFRGVGVQILAGTTQLKTYKAANFARQPGTHSIKYNPSSSCGTKTITIKNYATAALYNYTPYTPNAAALRNLYGSGDGCSSYGNRNFWRDYTDWFGPTRGTSVSRIDAVPHLLGLDASDELWAYPTNGRSGWLDRVSLGSPWAGMAKLLAPGDIDGDGHRDLITISSVGTVTLRHGTGGLEYDDFVVLDTGWPTTGLITAAGDFSGDGIPDVFTADGSGNMLLWRGTGADGFGTPITVGNGWSIFDQIVGGTDFSGDGIPDVLARRPDGSLFLYRGNGRGGWAGKTQVGAGWQVMTDIYLPGDFSGDRVPDVLAKDTAGRVWLYPGNGRGGFGARALIGNGWQTLSIVAGPGPAATGPQILSPGSGDLDGDGYRDITALTKTGELRLYTGNGRGGLSGIKTLAPTTPSGARFVTLGDFNEDSFPDLGRIDADGTFLLLPGTAAGTYGPATPVGNGWNLVDSVFGAIDFDGDRHLDVIARDAEGYLKLYRGDGDGGWIASGVQIGNGWGPMTAIFAAGGFDADAHPDILARRPDGALMLYSTNGNGGFLRSLKVGSGWNIFDTIFSPGDFDRAGGHDIVARKPDGTLMLYRTSGRGQWLGATVFNSGWQVMSWLG